MSELPPQDGFESSNNPSENWKKIEVLKEQINICLRGLLGKEDVEVKGFEEAREKSINLTEEIAGFIGSLEKRDPEDTANHYIEYYLPAIQEMRRSNDFIELNAALEKIKTENLTERFYTLKKKWGQWFKTRKGDFPLDTEEWRDFSSTKVSIKLLSVIEESIKELEE